jgi:hypothetical protein
MWDYAARELQDAARNAPPGSQQAGLYNDLARAVKNELDRLVPEYRQAREGALSFFQARDALEAGQNYATSRGLDNRQVRMQFAQLSPTQRQLFQDGFVDRLIQKVRMTNNCSNVAAQIGASDAAREQLDIALGPQKAKELMAFLHVENVMDGARKAVQGNSTTARQLFELGLAGGAGELLGGGFGNPLSDPTSYITTALIWGAAKGRAKINENVARQVAQLLTSGDANRINTAMRMIANSPRLFGAVKNTDAALAAIAARGAQLTTERH